MEIQMFDSNEEMLNAVRRAREAADAQVQPWQAAIKPGDFFVRVAMLCSELLTIYGEIIESPYPEDREIFAQPHMRHYRLSKCFSEACPEGEMGDVHVSSIRAVIEQEEFEFARLKGWPPLDGGPETREDAW